MLTQALRDQGVEVLYVTELLQDALEYQAARDGGDRRRAGRRRRSATSWPGQVHERLGGSAPRTWPGS